jgi:phosphoglycerate dehydrogenase-like enzyme
VAFRVGLTRALKAFEPPLSELVDLSPIETPPVEWRFLDPHPPELRPQHVDGFHAIVLAAARVTEATLSGSSPPRLIAVFGVGTDVVDVDACTRRGILVTITPEGISRPMAMGALTFVLALAHNLPEKERAAHEQGWPRRFGAIGLGVAGRTLGIVGYGRIGRELAALVQPLGMRCLAYSRSLTPEEAARTGVECAELPRLLAESEYVCVTVPLTDGTRGLIGAEELALMKPSAYLVNIARGAVVDEAALVEALRERRIAGAALDVFAEEPVPPDNPLLHLDNVLVAPHSIGYTSELMRESAASAFACIRAVAEGRVPANLVNPGALG